MHGQIEARITEMGYMIPIPFKYPKPNRTGCVQVGSLLLVSGHGGNLPQLPGVKHVGKITRDVTEQEGYATARAVALTILATLKDELGDLDRVKRVVRLLGMVNVSPGFDRMPAVIDGASDFFYEVFGPIAGKHARTAVGVAELPHGMPVEINAEFELKA
jgi:enamine deaminase RidA (YjgF/YER057c/UK114 family)